MRCCISFLQIALILLATSTTSVQSAQNHCIIGGWIPSPQSVLMERWGPIFQTYLTNTVGKLYNPPITFELVPFDYDIQTEAKSMIEGGKVDFASGGTTCLEAQFQFTTIATEVQIINGKEESAYGAVIYSLKSNSAIKNISDFHNKRLGVGYPLAPGGFQLGAQYLNDAGLNIYTEFSQIVFYMNDYAALLNGLIVGEVDVIMMQSGWVESNAPEYLSKLRIHNPIQASWYNVPYSLTTTTQLVPHYGITAAPHIPLRLQQQVADALGNLNASHPAAKGAGIARFGLPASYDSVRALVEKLGIMQHTANGGKKCLDVFSGVEHLISCPAGYALEMPSVLEMRCKTNGLSCPEGFTCFCRPCHLDAHVNIFPWQLVMGLCCALFAVGLCFSVGWVTVLQAEQIREAAVAAGKRTGLDKLV